MTSKILALSFTKNKSYVNGWVAFRYINNKKVAYVLPDYSNPPAEDGEIWFVRELKIALNRQDLCVVEVHLIRRIGTMKIGDVTRLRYRDTNRKGVCHTMCYDDITVVYVPDQRGLTPNNRDTFWKGALHKIIFWNEYMLMIAVRITEEEVTARTVRRRNRRVAEATM